MKKVILLGAKGQLGKALEKELSDSFEVSAFSKNELDITDFLAVKKVCGEIQPDFLVNAAAYTNVDGAEAERELALQINAEAVGNLAEACRTTGAKLIHFSTDYVFDGKSDDGYAEDAEPNPLNFYGETKLAGEKNIQASGCDFTIIRTSWLFGDGENFVTKMLTLAEKNSEIKVVSDQIGSPTFTEDLAQATKKIILNCHPRDLSAEALAKVEGGDPKKSKTIFHVTNSGTTSWADFARKIFDIKKLPTKVIDIPTAGFPTPAKRPKNSVLRNTKVPELRSWQEALEGFLNQKERCPSGTSLQM